jgi:hypothetical protein
MGFGFIGEDLVGVPVRAEGIQDRGQASTFMRSEINIERDKASHAAPPGAGRAEDLGVDPKITELVILDVMKKQSDGSIAAVQREAATLRSVSDLTVPLLRVLATGTSNQRI